MTDTGIPLDGGNMSSGPRMRDTGRCPARSHGPATANSATRASTGHIAQREHHSTTTPRITRHIR